MRPGIDVGSLNAGSGESSQRALAADEELDFAIGGRILRAAGVFIACIALVLPAVAQIPNATLTEVTNLNPPAYPRNLAAGFGGKVWFSEERLTPHSIGFFTPADGKVAKFPVPCDQCNGNGDRLAYIESITMGPDLNVWFLYTYVNGDGSPLNGGLNGFVGRMTPTGQFTSFAVPTVDAFRRFTFGQAGHSAITSGSDGNLWFTENVPGKIGRITTAGDLREYPLTSPLAAPSIITSGPDGNLWFTETGTGKIGRITRSGAATEFPVPRGSRAAAPFGITVGANDDLWYTDWSSAVGRITVTGVATRYDLEPSSVPNNITTGPDGKLYFPYFTYVGTAGDYQGKIAQLDPSTGSTLGKVITLDVPNKKFGNEDALVLQGNAGLFFNASGPDATAATGFGDLGVLRLEVGTAATGPCNPPVTVSNGAGEPSGVINVLLEVRPGSHIFQTTEIQGGTPPFTLSVSGNHPPDALGVIPSGNGRAIEFSWLPIDETLYHFTMTITDANGCTATIEYLLYTPVPRPRGFRPPVEEEVVVVQGRARHP